tara:strand:+ start:2180 stop:2818 length:639 start_codon:yes stop_codon:yes gene_type:complete
MIYLQEIVDEIKSDLLSGMTYNETRFDDEYIETKIHSARAHLISAYLIKIGKFINDAWVQTVDFQVDDKDQNCDVITFECPNVITTDGQNDGFVYVGHANGLKPFVRMRKGFSTLTRHSLFFKKKEIMWDYKHLEQGRNVLLFYNNSKLQYIQVRGMINNPTTIPNFDKYLDHYPIDMNLKHDIVEYVTGDLFRKTSRPAEPGVDNINKIPR